jgi:hypothetical protein
MSLAKKIGLLVALVAVMPSSEPMPYAVKDKTVSSDRSWQISDNLKQELLFIQEEQAESISSEPDFEPTDEKPDQAATE